jgi:HD-GYP domain-containing protein (c-di-GMP phosphodiesterase class II)
MAGIRLAELLGSLSFAGDLGRGQPMGHVLRTTRIAMALSDRLGVPSDQLPDVYFTGLLVHAGCTAGAAECAAFIASDELSAQKDFCLCDPANMGQLFGWMRRNVASDQPFPARAIKMLQLIARGEKCFEEVDQGCSEVGSRIALRMGLSDATQKGLFHICESWGGKGPHRLKGEDIPLGARIVNVAMILEVFFSERGIAAARDAAKARRGKTFDPAIADAAIDLCGVSDFWEGMREEEAWSSVLDLEPGPRRFVDESSLDDFAFALADIVDLKSATASVHSRQTAEIATGIAAGLRLSPEDVSLTRRAALVHDVGMVAVPSFLLDQGRRWSETDFERYRLHPYYTERILARSDALRPIGNVAACHHENVDGSGYHRSLTAGEMSLPSRVVATAAAYVEAMEGADGEPERALLALKEQRRLDPDCLSALFSHAPGTSKESPARRSWPAGLTDREVEVLRLVASGLSLKQTAASLVISDHTARHHLESIYGKAAVSSRAGVTLFAVENGLLV